MQENERGTLALDLVVDIQIRDALEQSHSSVGTYLAVAARRATAAWAYSFTK